MCIDAARLSRLRTWHNSCVMTAVNCSDVRRSSAAKTGPETSPTPPARWRASRVHDFSAAPASAGMLRRRRPSIAKGDLRKRIAYLVLRGPLRTVDDDRAHRSLGSLQFQTE